MPGTGGLASGEGSAGAGGGLDGDGMLRLLPAPCKPPNMVEVCLRIDPRCDLTLVEAFKLSTHS